MKHCISATLPATGSPVNIRIDDGRILAVEESGIAREPADGSREYGAGSNERPVSAGDRLLLVSGGFFDIQINGYGGREFSSPRLTVEDVFGIADSLWRFGTTRFLPTLTTQSYDVLAHGCRVICDAVSQDPLLRARIPGLHLEGPYISPHDGPRGAHPLAHVRAPDWGEFARLQDAADGNIRLITLSPEHEEAPEFIRRAVKAGVTVAIGHTAADGEQIARAVDAGAVLSTHLGNGAHPVLPRHPNYLWEQLGEDRLRASLIVEGGHLPPSFVRVAVRATSPERCILISDLSGMAGLPPGQYQTDLCPLEVLDDGRLVIAGQRTLLAGASRPIGQGIVNIMDFSGISLNDALLMAVKNPAELLSRPPARIEPGAPLDLVLFEIRDRPRLDGTRAPGKEDVSRRELVVREVFFRDFHRRWDD
ncbi:MAG: N-acetylglucosamine-6-phosphate deacetylase [Thermogutta sp.]